jgi:hypothetical protein
MRKPCSEETKRKIGVANKGHTAWNKGVTGEPRSEETKRKISEANKGHTAWNKGIPCTEEIKQRISKTLTGKPGTNKGKKVSEETKRKISEKLKGNVPWNKDKKGVYSEEMLKRLSDSHKGQKSWSKGKHGLWHHTDEAKKKLSEFHKGNQYCKGKKLTAETKMRISLAGKDRQFSSEHKRNISIGKTGGHRKPPSNITRIKMSMAQQKIDASCWRGFITPIRYRIEGSLQYSQWRQSVFLRDNFTCQDCKERGGHLHAHHKKPFSVLLKEAQEYLPLLNLYDASMMYSPLWDIFNGITLCKKCHKKKHLKHE